MTIISVVVKVGLTVALAASSLIAAPWVQAAPPPESEQYVVAKVGAFQNPNANTVFGFSGSLSDASGSPDGIPDGIAFTVVLSSCGREVAQQASVTKPASADQGSGRGFVFNFTEAQQKRIGRSIEYTVTFTNPGYDSYTDAGSYSGYNVRRPSCDEINGTGEAAAKKCKVTRASKRIGQARVGRIVKVTAPHTNGRCGRISYTWKANGTFVKRARTLRITPGLRGKTLVAVVKPARASATVVRLGRVR